jgi:hypothetical protein
MDDIYEDSDLDRFVNRPDPTGYIILICLIAIAAIIFLFLN